METPEKVNPDARRLASYAHDQIERGEITEYRVERTRSGSVVVKKYAKVEVHLARKRAD